jgi:hypothetical protein
VRRDEHVLHCPQRRSRGHGSSTVTSRAAPLICRRASAPMRAARRLRARCHVEKIRWRPSAAERVGIARLLGFRRQRTGQAAKPACGRSVLSSDITAHRICVSGSVRVAADAACAHMILAELESAHLKSAHVTGLAPSLH